MDWFFTFPHLASEHGGQIDRLIVIMHMFMLAVLLVGAFLFIYPLVRYRKKVNPTADYHGLKSKAPYLLAVFMAVVDAVLLIFFSIPFWEREVNAYPQEEDNPFEVRVVAQQFQWYFHYPGPDGIFGDTDIDLIDDQENPLGLDREDPNEEDDVYSPVLHIPVNRTVLIYLTTRDVIHSLNLPELRVKQDAIPGMSIPVHFTPTMTTKELREVTGKEDREFEIACAQLCGLGHYRMKGIMIVETEEELQAWYDEELEYKQQYASEDVWWE